MKHLFRELFDDPELRITKEDVVQGAALLLFVAIIYYATCGLLYAAGVL